MSEKVKIAIEKRKARGKLFRARQKENKKLKRSNSDSALNVSPDLDTDEVYYECYNEFNVDETSNLDNHFSSYSSDGSEYSSDDSDDDSDHSDNAPADACIKTMQVVLLITQLRRWALKSGVSNDNLNLLLAILYQYFKELPLSSKTLKKTNSQLVGLIKKFNPGDPTDCAEYVYFGISRYLTKMVNVALHKVKVLKLQFNMDGLPIFNSSKLEFWPILGKIFSVGNFNYKPFIIAIHSGIGKPKSLEKYLADFIEELNHLLKHGIVIKGQKFAVEVMCFICDRPARSFIKCIKGHGGYYACERCHVIGEPCKNRTVYAKIGTDRTDNSFRNQESVGHHLAVSPLVRIPGLDMIKHFVLDMMHLVFLGVVKKLITDYWLGAKMLRNDMLRLSKRLINISNQMPCEFQRTTRSLGEITNWKATEYRFFLLYPAAFVLKGLLPDRVYKHFLLLVVSFRILSSDSLCHKFFTHAKLYLTKFVLSMESIYGKESLVLNVHSLCHIADDVKNMLCSLSRITAFPFENLLGHIKKYIRSGRKPLVQVCKRMEEEWEVDEEVVHISEIKVLKSKKMADCIQIQRLQFYDSELTTKNPNNTVILKDKRVVQIDRMTCLNENDLDNNTLISRRTLEILGPALDYPSDSSVLDMYQVKVPEKEANENSKTEFSVSDIMCKMVLIKVFEFETDPQEWYVVPLLHCS